MKRLPASLVLLLLHQEADSTGDERYRIKPATLRSWTHRGHITRGTGGYDLQEILKYIDNRERRVTIMDVRCAFSLRWPASEPGQFQYLSINVDSRDGHGRIPTPHPPAVGDLVNLHGDAFRSSTSDPEPVHGTFRVVERVWLYPEYGSNDWPLGQAQAKQGPLLDVFVEYAEGAFANQAEDDI